MPNEFICLQVDSSHKYNFVELINGIGKGKHLRNNEYIIRNSDLKEVMDYLCTVKATDDKKFFPFILSGCSMKELGTGIHMFISRARFLTFFKYA